MTRATALLVGSVLLMTLTSPAWARTVTIETAVPLAGHSPDMLERAFKEALDTTVRGAAAMGFSFIRLDGAQVLGDTVVVRMVATDDDSEDDPDADSLRAHGPPDPAPDGF